MRKLLTLSIIMFLGMSSPAFAVDAWIFVFWGQSNMRGSGTVGAERDAPSEYQIVNTNLRIWHNYYRQIQYYLPGYNSDTASVLDIQPQYWGPEASFGRSLIAETPNQVVYFLKYSIGGTRLAPGDLYNTWHPSENELFNMVTYNLNQLKAVLTAQGFTPVVKGIIGMQGESDTVSALIANAYKNNKLDFFVSARALWGDANTIFVDGRTNIDIVPADLPFTTTIQTAQACAAALEAQTKARLVDTDGLPLKSDILHFQPNSYITIGSRLYEAYMNRVQITLPNPAGC